MPMGTPEEVAKTMEASIRTMAFHQIKNRHSMSVAQVTITQIITTATAIKWNE
jgi:hypothetical protein